MVNEPTWYSADPIQTSGDVPVYQQCGIGTIVGKIMRNHSQNIVQCMKHQDTR